MAIVRPLAALALAASLSAAALAAEYPIGAAQHRNGMEIAAVYLQPVEMESVMGHMLPATRRTCIWRPTSTP